MSEPWRSYHPTDGRTGNGVRDRAADKALHDRRTAIDELGAALRALVEHATVTEVDAETIRRVAAEVRRVTAPLAERTRGRTQLPRADDLLGGVRMYNPVSGTGSAFAPPVRCARSPAQSPYAGSEGDCGMGSQLQRSAPVRAS